MLVCRRAEGARTDWYHYMRRHHRPGTSSHTRALLSHPTHYRYRSLAPLLCPNTHTHTPGPLPHTLAYLRSAKAGTGSTGTFAHLLVPASSVKRPFAHSRQGARPSCGPYFPAGQSAGLCGGGESGEGGGGRGWRRGWGEVSVHRSDHSRGAHWIGLDRTRTTISSGSDSVPTHRVAERSAGPDTSPAASRQVASRRSAPQKARGVAWIMVEVAAGKRRWWLRWRDRHQ